LPWKIKQYFAGRCKRILERRLQAAERCKWILLPPEGGVPIVLPSTVLLKIVLPWIVGRDYSAAWLGAFKTA
jgi:hypothetical protein